MNSTPTTADRQPRRPRVTRPATRPSGPAAGGTGDPLAPNPVLAPAVPNPADDGQPYDEFDDTPQNLARFPRHQREEQERLENQRRDQERLEELRRPWAEKAEALADWTGKHLLNRNDVWGQYNAAHDRTNGTARTMPSKADRGTVRLQREDLIGHYAADRPENLLGLHTTSEAGTSRWIAWDIDNHAEGDSPEVEQVREDNLRNAIALYQALKELGMRPLLTESNGNGGYHVRVILKEPVPVGDAYAFGRQMATTILAKIETFPKQRTLKNGELGNWLRLPGRHHTRRHFTRVWSGNEWLEGEDAIDTILAMDGDDPTAVVQLAGSVARASNASPPGGTPATASTTDQPRATWLRGILDRVPIQHLDDYDDWLRVGFAIYTELAGEDGLALWDEASKRSKKYQPDACRNKWGSFGNAAADRVTLGTIIYWIRIVDPSYTPPARPGPEGVVSIPMMSWADLHADNPRPQYNPTVIDGLLRRGELMNLISGTKVGKSWLAMQLAVATAAGMSWLGRWVEKGKVLLIDGELHCNTLQVRLEKVAEAMGVKDLAGVRANIVIVPLRNLDADICTIETLVKQFERGHFNLIILDPMYKLLPRGASEIVDHDVRDMYARLLRIADRTGAGVVVIHHTTKGDQSKKSLTDTGSGHGVLSRAPDTHLSLLPVDEEQDVTHANVRATTRTFPPPKSLILRKKSQEVPIWEVEDEAARTRADTCSEGKDLSDAMLFVAICARPNAESKKEIVGRHQHFKDSKGVPLTKRRAEYLFAKAVRAGFLMPVGTKDRRDHLFRRDATGEEKHQQQQDEQLRQVASET